MRAYACRAAHILLSATLLFISVIYERRHYICARDSSSFLATSAISFFFISLLHCDNQKGEKIEVFSPIRNIHYNRIDFHHKRTYTFTWVYIQKERERLPRSFDIVHKTLKAHFDSAQPFVIQRGRLTVAACSSRADGKQQQQQRRSLYICECVRIYARRAYIHSTLVY